MMAQRFLTTVIVFICIDASVMWGQENLKEAARARGGIVNRKIGLELPVMELPALIANADLVVQARVSQQRTTLNRDETSVMTEYVLAPLRIPLARFTVSVARPEQVKIIVRRPGGRLVVDGLTLITDVSVYTDDANLKTGEEALFFLSRDQEEGIYRPVCGPFGIFRIGGGQTKPLTSRVAQRRGDKPAALGDVLATVERLAAAEARR